MDKSYNWIIYGLLSALFAGITAILAKIGIREVNSNLATAIRTIVIIIFAWGIVLFQGTYKQIPSLSRHTLVFLILSGIATGLSWLFYFRALQLGEASKVAPIDKLSIVFTIIFAVILLKEKISIFSVAGIGLVILGTILTTIK